MQLQISAVQLLFKALGWLLLGFLVGYSIGYTTITIVIFSLVLIAWQHHHLNKLVDWLWRSKAISPPQAEGAWGRVYDGLNRIIQKYRRKQKQLNEKIRRFRDGAEALPDAALVLSTDLTILWGNQKAQQLMGIRWPGDVGQRIDNLIRFPEFTQYIEKADFEQPCNVPSPVNSEIQLELRMMPYGSEQVLFLARDISKVYRLDEMRRDFVANVSHELKTPLTVMRGYVEMVQSAGSGVDARWQSAFNTMEDQVTRMDRLVEQLLILSRVEVNTDIAGKLLIKMPLLIEGLINDADWLNQEKSHEITTNICPELDLYGIDSEIKSACSNLISNAIAYTPLNGKIEVSWQLDGARAKFMVKDNGEGIRPIDLNRLTERFYRVDKSRSRDTGGSGLGLAIVKHVASHHQAELVINSVYGQGSEFSLYFDSSAFVKRR